MELNINSPSYYKNIYGIDDDIYWMCRGISDFVKDKRYSEVVNTIAITPIVAPRELIEQGKWKEETIYAIKSGLIIVSKHIEFEEYVNSSMEEKKKLIVGNILKSVKAIKNKGKINYFQFQDDILEFLGFTKKDVGI